MLDVGWAELMVIGVVALIVIGPKDLPDMFRQLGRFMSKIRMMGRDFQRAMDEADFIRTKCGLKIFDFARGGLQFAGAFLDARINDVSLPAFP